MKEDLRASLEVLKDRILVLLLMLFGGLGIGGVSEKMDHPISLSAPHLFM